MVIKKFLNSLPRITRSIPKEFTFEEWQSLSFKEKISVSKAWNPYQPEIGRLTRNAILEGFIRSYPNLAKQSHAIGYDYFGWTVGCIYIVVSKSSIKVPKEFASLFVNKGYIYKRINGEVVLVNWRYGGTKAEFKLRKK